MEISTEDYRRHYDSLSDAALLEIDSSQLVESARVCYEAELAARGIAPKAPAEAEILSATGTPLDPGQELVPIAMFETVGEADLARAMLESGGIPSGFDKTGLTLLVPASLADDANEILNSELTDEELAAQAEAAGEEGEP